MAPPSAHVPASRSARHASRAERRGSRTKAFGMSGRTCVIKQPGQALTRPRLEGASAAGDPLPTRPTWKTRPRRPMAAHRVSTSTSGRGPSDLRADRNRPKTLGLGTGSSYGAETGKPVLFMKNSRPKGRWRASRWSMPVPSHTPADMSPMDVRDGFCSFRGQPRFPKTGEPERQAASLVRNRRGLQLQATAWPTPPKGGSRQGSAVELKATVADARVTTCKSKLRTSCRAQKRRHIPPFKIRGPRGDKELPPPETSCGLYGNRTSTTSLAGPDGGGLAPTGRSVRTAGRDVSVPREHNLVPEAESPAGIDGKKLGLDVVIPRIQTKGRQAGRAKAPWKRPRGPDQVHSPRSALANQGARG